MTYATAFWVPVMWMLLTLLHPTGASSDDRAEVRHYEVHIQVKQNGALKTVEQITTANSTLERRLPLEGHDQKGNHWVIRYSEIHALVDDQPTHCSQIIEDGQLLLRIDQIPNEPAHQQHSITIEYVSLGAIQKNDGLDELNQTIGGNWQIERLDVYLALPDNVPSDDIQFNAFTAATSSTLGCDCVISHVPPAVQVTRVIKPGESLKFMLALKSGYIKKDLSESLEAIRTSNTGAVAWVVFAASVFTYYLLVFGLLRLSGQKTAVYLRSSEQKILVLVAGGLSLLSLIGLAIVQQPAVAMPGIYGGILASMVFGGSLHGPSQRYLWIPFAFILNALFYYILTQLIRAVLARIARDTGSKASEFTS